MDLLTTIKILRVVFLICLGVQLLRPNEVCRVGSGVSAVVLGLLVLIGKF